MQFPDCARSWATGHTEEGPMSKKSDAILKELRAFGLGYPGVETKSPWPGHDDLAVKGKTFAYLSLAGEPFGISLKLPYTGAEALRLSTPSPRPMASAGADGSRCSRRPTKYRRSGSSNPGSTRAIAPRRPRSSPPWQRTRSNRRHAHAGRDRRRRTAGRADRDSSRARQRSSACSIARRIRR